MRESGKGLERLRTRLRLGGDVASGAGSGELPLVLDGALGTELERRGSPAALPLWSTHALLHQPDLVREIHRDYVRSGAEILTANTFRTQRHVLAKAGLGEQAGSLCALAVSLAKEASEADEREIFVAGSAPPLEDCYRPDLVPDMQTLQREHGAHAHALAAAGADLILFETINCVREAAAAASAAAEVGLPAFVSFVPNDQGQLLSGESFSEALDAVQRFEVLAVGVNCLPADSVAASLQMLERCDRELPLMLSPNLGAPDAQAGRSAHLSPRGFAHRMLLWSQQARLRVVGGCCGTTPEHTRALSEVFSASVPLTGRDPSPEEDA